MDSHSRWIRGSVVLPPECPRATARITVELRDVTYADDAAPLIAVVETGGASIGPGVRYPFELSAPESPAGTALSLACRVELVGGEVPAAEGLVSVQSIPVPAHGPVDGVEIPVTRIG